MGTRGRARRRGSSAQLREAVDVEREPPAVDRDDEAEADAHLRGGHRHHREREDLAGAVVRVAREGDQGEVRSVQHDLEREQDDDRVAADQHAERADREQERGDADVPGDVRAHHPRLASSCWERRVCEPRMTPPTAAISRTTDVISNASRWFVRNSRPIHAGEPKVALIGSVVSSRLPALRPSTTMTSRKIAPAASTAPTVCHRGPPSHGVSWRGPTYAMTNRNITMTAPA